MKKIMARVLVLIISLPFIFQINILQTRSFAETPGIVDLGDCAQFSKDAVVRLVSSGIIAGDTNHRFNPKGDVTRAQVITFIVKALGLSLENPSSPSFSDVTKQHWSYRYIETAFKYGITAGTSPATFSPDRYCTREELVTMLIKANRINPSAMGDGKIQQILDGFKDAGQISPWARGPMAYAYAQSIIAGYHSEVTPKNLATREQTAVILDNYMTKYATSYGQQPVIVDNLSTSGIAQLRKSVVKVVTYGSDGNPVAQGSGFCIGESLFLTNFHVLEYGYSAKIITDDGTSYDCSGMAIYDSGLDLAVLKAKAPVNVEPLSIGSKDALSQGDHVLAIGSPLGLSNTVSDGIVSGIREEGGESLIQTTAPITHGSSGGPLINMQGQVVGITSAGYDSGDLNLAIPVDYALDWINSYKTMNFDSIPSINMATDPDLTGGRNDAVTAINGTIGDMLGALGREDVEAYRKTLSPDNPAYAMTYIMLEPLFEDYDLNYSISAIHVTRLMSAAADVEVTYDITRVNGLPYRNRRMTGKYSLEYDGSAWRILSADEQVSSYLQ